MKRIKGTVTYVNLSGGFWGIRANNGTEYRPVNMPEQLKKNDASVSVSLVEVEEMSIFMWGTPCRIISFETPMP